MKLTLTKDSQKAFAEAIARNYNMSSCARVENPQKQLLLVRRASSQLYAGIWEMPGGGVEKNESLEGTLTRELKEEIGLANVQSISLLGYFDFHNVETNKVKRKFCFEISVGSDFAVKLDEDHDEYKWFSRKEIEELKRESQHKDYEIWDDHYHLLLDY